MIIAGKGMVHISYVIHLSSGATRVRNAGRWQHYTAVLKI